MHCISTFCIPSSVLTTNLVSTSHYTVDSTFHLSLATPASFLVTTTLVTVSTFNRGLYVQLCFRLFMWRWNFPNSWTSLFYHIGSNTRFTSIRGHVICQGCPGSSLVKQETQETWVWSWVGKIFWRRKWQPTQVFLPAKFHGQRTLVGYSPWGRKESGMTEQLRMHREEKKMK